MKFNRGFLPYSVLIEFEQFIDSIFLSAFCDPARGFTILDVNVDICMTYC
jgi:hypothetical protein